MTARYKTQVMSDASRDGLGVELLDQSGDVVAEVFRSDRERTVSVNTVSLDMPLEAIELLIARAKEKLEPFQNGMPLSKSLAFAPRLIRSPASDGAQPTRLRDVP